MGEYDFWKLRGRKSLRRCGAKHIYKSKCTKHTILRPLLEVATLKKKCPPLWREANFKVKNVKNWQVRTNFDVQMSKKCTPLWREANFQVKSVKNWQVRTNFDVQMSKLCTPLWREANFQVKSVSFVASARGCAPFVKSEQNVRVL